MATPFIHTFKTPGGYYSYDVNTNALLKINFDIYTYLRTLELEQNFERALEKTTLQLGADRARKAVDYLEINQKKGFFSTKRAKTIQHYAEELYLDLTSKYMHQLILQVTENCNLRCNYCPYSGKYYDRNHSDRNMSEKTAQKAIDFFLKRTTDSSNIALSFYGGEPLLNFELIQKAITYFEIMAQGRDYRFSLTTNGTLLTEDKLRYFVEKNVHLLVSLDGPKKIHDRNRRFISGLGSYDQIMTSIALAEKKFPEYTKKNLKINSVLEPESNFCSVNEFFTTSEAFKEIAVMGNVVSQSNLKETEININQKARLLFCEEIEYEIFKYHLSKNRPAINFSSIVKQWEEKSLADILQQRVFFNGIHEQIHPSGPCIPGILRLFVSTDERLFPCERVCESGNACVIGTLETGIDKAKAISFLNIGKLTAEQCLNCWAWQFCTSCLAKATHENQIDKSTKLSWCQKIKANAEEKLKKYCVLKELGIPINETLEVLQDETNHDSISI